jgi:ankyrin repeat protein
VQSRVTACCEYLLKAGAAVTTNKAGDLAIFAAIKTDDGEMVKTMKRCHARFSGGGERSGNGETLLAQAIRSNAWKVFDVLVETAQDYDLNSPSRFGMLPLSMLVVRGNLARVRQMVDKGADPLQSVNGVNTPLGVAAKGGQIEILDCMLEACQKLPCEPKDEGGYGLLYQAVVSGQCAMVAYLLDRGVSVDDEANGRRVLDLCVSHSVSDPAIVGLLLERGADPHWKSHGAESPMQAAMRSQPQLAAIFQSFESRNLLRAKGPRP